MPLPPSSFTKSKWLAFFAEMTAKINHHNPVIVSEGCDMVRRLLSTRISVGAFLEEGAFIQHLLDVIEGIARVERLPTPLDIEMLDALFRTLFLVIDMMASLAFDGDAYYLLLVSARSSKIMQTLARVLESNTRLYFGRCSYYLHVLLTLPLATALHTEWAMDLLSNVTLRSHVRGLEENVRDIPKVLQELTQSMQAIANATKDHAVMVAAQTIWTLSLQQSRRFQRHLLNAPHDSGASQQPQQVGEPTSGYAFANQSADDETGNERPQFPPSVVEDVFSEFGKCKNHSDFFVAMNHLWCLTVARRDIVADTVHATTFQPVIRFLSAAPKSGVDRVLFASILSWVTVMGSVESLRRELLESIAAMVPTHFMPMFSGMKPTTGCDESQTRGGAAGHPTSTMSSSSTPFNQSGAASAGGLVRSFIHPQSANISEHQSDLAAAPPARGADIRIHIMSFMIFLEHTCTATMMQAWLRGGLLSFIDSVVRMASSVRSILVDAPSTVDGALSDEAYLGCALESSRSELVTLAASACKLLCAVMVNFSDLLLAEFPRESSSAVELLVPQLLKIVLNNPTLSSAQENKPGSILHHVHRCHRALRSTPIGECAAVALDACLALLSPGELEMNKLREIMLLVPALIRATKNSVVPHIRALVYRVLIRLCGAPSHLVLMVREMPSIMSTAVKCVLDVNPQEPQWESAAAAEWLVRVIAVAALDSSVETSFDVSQTALTVRLLHIVSSLPIGCTSAAMLALCTAMYEQFERIHASGTAQAAGQVPLTLVLEPYGSKSLHHWSQLLLCSANANRALTKVCQSMQPTRCSTRDVFSRALAVYEDVAAQFCHAASASHGIRYLIEAVSSRREGLGDTMVFEFVSAALATPSPDALSEMTRVRFGDACPAATSVVTKAYDYMIQSVSALLSVWVAPPPGDGTCSVHLLEPLPQHLLLALVALMKDPSVASSTRLHLTKIVNSTHTVPNQPAIRQSFDGVAADLFEASLTLQGDAPALVAMRCRLLAEHKGASASAMSTGWLHHHVVEPLHKFGQIISSASKANDSGSSGSVKEIDIVGNLLSYMASFLSNSECVAIPAEYTDSLASSWLRLLRVERTHATALRCLPFVIRSSSGRSVALSEPHKAGEVFSRSCLGFALHWALPLTAPPNVLRATTTTARASRRSKVRSSEVHLHAQVMNGLAAAMTLDTDPCARCLMKVRSFEVLEDNVIIADAQHVAPSVLDMKVLAAASLCTDVQAAIARSSELMTAVLATAEERPTQEVGVLALMVIRNLCFAASLKIQMCQDSRVLFLLRNALLCLGTSAGHMHARHVGGDHQSPSALDICTEVMQRQELAARALWSLTHNNERGKAYVRGVLQAQSAYGGFPLSVNNNNNKSGSGASLCIPQHYAVGPHAAEYHARMEEALKMLTSQEVIKSLSD